jgi:hypothetical protein
MAGFVFVLLLRICQASYNMAEADHIATEALTLTWLSCGSSEIPLTTNQGLNPHDHLRYSNFFDLSSLKQGHHGFPRFL